MTIFDHKNSSILDGIKGIGKIKKLRIINFYGNIKSLKQTNLNELLQIEGINKELAKTIIRKINNE